MPASQAATVATAKPALQSARASSAARARRPARVNPNGSKDSRSGAVSVAIAPGLVWVSDDQPGIRRLRHGDGFRYRDAQGRAVRDPEVLHRIRQLAIPPAYGDVWICSLANGHLQATGRDARGRKQYRYHADWQAGRGQTKFDHLRVFGRVLPRLRRAVQRRLAAPTRQPTREQVLATLVRLLDATFMRIGNDEYARTNGSYGLSTLQAHHAGVRGAELKLCFKGKSGVQHEVRLNDRRVARVLRRCRELPGQALFHYLGDDGAVHRLGSSDVNAWLAASAGTSITAKDFRTWHGSVLALDLTLMACEALARPDNTVHVTPKMVLAEVARRLGNTPAVCRKAYIHPAILALGELLGPGVDHASARQVLLQRSWVTAPPPGAGLALAERRLLALLAGLPQSGRRSSNAGTAVAKLSD